MKVSLSLNAHFTRTLKNQRRRMIKAVHVFFYLILFPTTDGHPSLRIIVMNNEKINKNAAHINTDKRIKCTIFFNKNPVEFSDLFLTWHSIELISRSYRNCGD